MAGAPRGSATLGSLRTDARAEGRRCTRPARGVARRRVPARARRRRLGADPGCLPPRRAQRTARRHPLARGQEVPERTPQLPRPHRLLDLKVSQPPRAATRHARAASIKGVHMRRRLLALAALLFSAGAAMSLVGVTASSAGGHVKTYKHIFIIMM